MSRKRKRERAAQQADEAAKLAPAPAIGTALGAVLKRAGVTVQPPRSVGNVGKVGEVSKFGKADAKSEKRNVVLPRDIEPAVRVTSPARAANTAALSTTELRMLNDAYEGARPLERKRARAKPVAESEVAARNPLRDATLNAEVRSAEFAARSRLAALVSEGVRFKLRREDDYVEGLRADTSPKLLARIQGRGFAPEAKLDLHGLRGNQVEPALERFVRMHHRRGARHLLVIVGKGLHSEDGTSVLAPAAIDALSHGLAAPWVVAFCSAHAVHGGGGAFAVLLRD